MVFSDEQLNILERVKQRWQDAEFQDEKKELRFLNKELSDEFGNRTLQAYRKLLYRAPAVQARTKARRKAQAAAKARTEQKDNTSFKSYAQIALWQIAYAVARLFSDVAPALRSATVKTGCNEVDALLSSPIADDVRIICTEIDKQRVKPVVWECVERKRPSKLEMLSAIQLHKTSDVMHEGVERLHADATPQTFAFFYIMYWRTRSPVTVKYFVDHLEALNAMDHTSMIQYFVDTYNCPSLTLSCQITRENAACESARRKSIRFSNYMLAAYADAESFAQLVPLLQRAHSTSSIKEMCDLFHQLETWAACMPLVGPYSKKNMVDCMCSVYSEPLVREAWMAYEQCSSGTNTSLVLSLGKAGQLNDKKTKEGLEHLQQASTNLIDKIHERIVLTLEDGSQHTIFKDDVAELFNYRPLQLNVCKMLTWMRTCATGKLTKPRLFRNPIWDTTQENSWYKGLLNHGPVEELDGDED